MDYYLIDAEQLEKLAAINQRLQSGTDVMRDEGHRLWLLCAEVMSQKTDLPA